MTKYFVLIVTIFLSVFSLANAQVKGFKDTRKFVQAKSEITVASAFANLGSWGHYPVRVTIRNESASSQVFTLEGLSEVSGSNYYVRGANQSGIKTTTNFKLSCPGGSEKTFELNVPIAMATYSDNYFGSSFGDDWIAQNSLQLTFTNGKEKLVTSVTGEHTSRGTPVVSSQCQVKYSSLAQGANGPFNAVVDFDLLPDTPKGMVGYDDFYLFYSDWDQLTDQNQQTLKAWVKEGGSLMIINEKLDRKVMSLLTSFFDNAKFENSTNKSTADFYNGRVVVCLSRSVSRMPNSNDYSAERNKINLSSLRKDFSEGTGSSAQWPIQKLMGDKGFGVIPVTIMLIIFAVIIGPINFFVLAKQGKRHRLFFTTPLISIAMCLLLIAFISLKDGLGGDGRRILLKEVDQETNTAHIIQEQFCRTGMLLGSSFELDNDYSMNQVQIADSRWARASREKSSSTEEYIIERGEENSRYSGGYFASRSEHGHLVVGTQVTQESISVTSQGDTYEVLSTFKEPLETLYLKVEKKYYVAQSLITGQPSLANRITIGEWRNGIASQEDKLTKTNKRILLSYASRDNSYVAFSTSSEGIETHQSIDWDTEAVITGKLTLNISQ